MMQVLAPLEQKQADLLAAYPDLVKIVSQSRVDGRKTNNNIQMQRLIDRIIFKICNSHPLMRRLGFKLGEHVDLWKPNGLKVYIDIEIREPSQMAYAPIFNMHAGPIVQTGHQKANSFVQNFLGLLAYFMGNALASMALIDETNTSRTLGSIIAFDCRGASGSSTLGIRCGTGTSAASATDYEVTTIIAQGSGAGQLNYQLGASNLAVTSGNTVTCTNVRQFINNSGGSITIKEVGLGTEARDSGNTIRNFLWIHDVLASTYTVAIGNSATVTYTFSTTT